MIKLQHREYQITTEKKSKLLYGVQYCNEDEIINGQTKGEKGREDSSKGTKTGFRLDICNTAGNKCLNK